jgi:DNA invertase Pin-like site-specific DNA recombinase
MEIVQEYSDHGRSGLNIAGREGLNKLMSDVESKRTDFSALLVYDVSRWGRFLPRLDVLTERLSLRPDNGLIMDVYRFNNLNFFMEMAQRVRMEGTA